MSVGSYLTVPVVHITDPEIYEIERKGMNQLTKKMKRKQQNILTILTIFNITSKSFSAALFPIGIHIKQNIENITL